MILRSLKKLKVNMKNYTEKINHARVDKTKSQLIVKELKISYFTSAAKTSN